MGDFKVGDVVKIRDELYDDDKNILSEIPKGAVGEVTGTYKNIVAAEFRDCVILGTIDHYIIEKDMIEKVA